MTKGNMHDPKGLIYESFQMEHLTEGECRSIFLDWALSLPLGSDTRASLTALLDQYGASDHPMTGVLRAGLQDIGQPRRRGGARARPRGQ